MSRISHLNLDAKETPLLAGFIAEYEEKICIPLGTRASDDEKMAYLAGVIRSIGEFITILEHKGPKVAMDFIEQLGAECANLPEVPLPDGYH